MFYLRHALIRLAAWCKGLVEYLKILYLHKQVLVSTVISYLGMAFQIMDDVLDFMGTEEEMGKPVGNDLLQGTLTLPVLLFAEQNPNEPSVRRLKAGGSDPVDLRTVIDMVRESPVIQETLAVMDDYRDKARAALQRVPSPMRLSGRPSGCSARSRWQQWEMSSVPRLAV